MQENIFASSPPTDPLVADRVFCHGHAIGGVLYELWAGDQYMHRILESSPNVFQSGFEFTDSWRPLPEELELMHAAKVAARLRGELCS